MSANGSRGAKGSVNDRVISYLYRKRYKEYLRKKEYYTEEQRRKAREYLNKIKYFDIEDNIDVLDEDDKKILDDVFSTLKVEDFLKDPEKEKILNPELEKVDGYDKLSDLKSISEPTFDSKKDISNLDADDILPKIDVDELIQEGKKVSDFDPYKEDFDFDKYDYYEVIGNYRGIGDLSNDEVIDAPKEEQKLEDEEIIIKEVTEFVNDAKDELSEIKFELNEIKESIPDLHTEEDVKKLDEKFDQVKDKLEKLKEKYEVIKKKYDFEDYEILDNIKLIETITDYKDKASLDELELMVDACKYEIEAIDGIVIEEEKKVGIDEQVDEKYKLIKQRDRLFEEKKEETYGIENTNLLLTKELIEQQKILTDLQIKISKVTTETELVRETVYDTGRLFNSFLRITAGILTAPLSIAGIGRTMLGANLINRGLRGLRESLTPSEQFRVQYRDRYEDVENEILRAKNKVSMTSDLIDASLIQIKDIKDKFDFQFQNETQYLPEYSEVKGMIDKLEKSLTKKKEEINKLDKVLDNQYTENKQKVLRSQRPYS